MPTMKRTLHLRRETLAPLTHDDLAGIAAGAYTVGDHCGPPFDTRWLDAVVATVKTITPQTSRTCTC
jgi:hypothetical protein